MKILLIDVDSKIPNIVLMKLSQHHKNNGDDVEIIKIGQSAFPNSKRKIINIDGSDFDKVYASIIFTSNKNIINIKNCEYEIGGTGYDIYKKLPNEIDNSELDYSIYPENNKSYGFITRGCIRNCWFCFVPKKEGMIQKYRDVRQIVKHKDVVFMDNNILGYKDHIKIFEEILNMGIKLTFNQGLDIRLLNDENMHLLSKMNYSGEYIFAFDDIKYLDVMNKKIKVFKNHIDKDWKAKFYIYCNPKEDIVGINKRIDWCRSNKVLPYIMRDFSCYDDINKDFYTDIASWCNQPGLFKNMPFEKFVNKRTKNKERIDKSMKLFNQQS